ncbi:glycosyltransferase family 2 protein [Siccirubricoccus phaeus]|uniref:glycosyltransferase family 2 protein n=1 Tax=Siccirubricoccus phaeus TaxID=2595053 RepID=UPI0011F11581|nr:glycosyltransferase family 2 protein [Siccirubricoccus phaeus]
MFEAVLPALLPALLFAGHALWRWRRLRLPAVKAEGRVTLILPITGPQPGLEALLDCLAAQSLQPRRLVVAVESRLDPAHARITALAHRCPFPVQVVLAGHVPWRGQKNTNIIKGISLVDEEDDAAVLLDADIRPQPWWLSAAASPAILGTHDIVTGFRWQSLEGRGLIGHLVAWIDRMGAVLILPPRFGLVWGGTVGLSRRALAVLDLPRLLDRALVDDLTIGQAARRRGLRVLPRGAITVPTPKDGDTMDQLRFMRRQLQVVRICQPGFWTLLMGVSHLSVLGWLYALSQAPAPWALLLLGMFAASGVTRAVAHAGIGARIGARDSRPALAVQMLAGALPPLADGLVALLGWSMLRTRLVRWRHVEYRVEGPEAVRVVARFPPLG